MTLARSRRRKGGTDKKPGSFGAEIAGSAKPVGSSTAEKCEFDPESAIVRADQRRTAAASSERAEPATFWISEMDR